MAKKQPEKKQDKPQESPFDKYDGLNDFLKKSVTAEPKKEQSKK